MKSTEQHADWIAGKMFELMGIVGQLNAAAECIGFKETVQATEYLKTQVVRTINAFEADQKRGK